MNKFQQILTAGVVTLVSLSASFAQKGFEVGVRLIPQNTWYLNQEDADKSVGYDFKPTFGFAYGLTAGYNFTDGIGIQTGVIFSGQGQQYDNSDTNPNGVILANRKLNYTKIPLLLKFSSNSESGTSFYATLGVQYGILSKASLTGSNDKDYTFLGVTTSTKDFYKSSDLAAVLSFGPRFRVNENIQITAELRFDYSLSDVENTAAKVPFTTLNVVAAGTSRPASQNATGGLAIGVNYNFGAK